MRSLLLWSNVIYLIWVIRSSCLLLNLSSNVVFTTIQLYSKHIMQLRFTAWVAVGSYILILWRLTDLKIRYACMHMCSLCRNTFLCNAESLSLKPDKRYILLNILMCSSLARSRKKTLISDRLSGKMFKERCLKWCDGVDI